MAYTHHREPEYDESLAPMPQGVKNAEAKQWAFLLANTIPPHPSLDFKKRKNSDDVMQFRINRNVRAYGDRVGNDIYWHTVETKETGNKKRK